MNCTIQKNLSFGFVACTLVLLCLSPQAEAATDVWNGGGAPDGNWSNGANWGGTPPGVTGDNLIFNGSAQPFSTNDFVTSVDGVELNPLVPFAVSGQTLTILNGLTNSAQNNAWSVPMVNNNFTISVAPGTTLTTLEPITNSGSFIMSKEDAGTLVLSGTTDNAFMRATVNDGILVLSNTASGPGIHALGGGSAGQIINSNGVIVLSGSGGDQISDGSNVTINEGGVLDLNGRNEAIRAFLTGGSGINGGGAIINSSVTPATLTVNVSSTLITNTVLNGVGDIIFDGPGRFRQQSFTKEGANTVIFRNGTNADNAGLTMIVNNGTVVLDKLGAISSQHTASALTVNDGGTLILAGSGGYQLWQGGAHVVNSGGVLDMNGQSQTLTTTAGLTISGEGKGGGALVNNSSTNSALYGPLTLAADSSVGGNGDLELAGQINAGPYQLTKVGTGVLTTTAGNIYTNNTIVKAGTLRVSFYSQSAVSVESGAAVCGVGSFANGVTLQSGGAILGGDLDYTGVLQIFGASLNLGPAEGPAAPTYSRFMISAGGTIDTPSLTVNGTNTILIQDSSLVVGTNTLITYGEINYVGNSGFKLGPLPAGVVANVLDTGSAIQLAVTSTNAVPSNPPVLGGATVLSDHNISLSFTGDPGVGYTVRATSDLTQALSSWTIIGNGAFDEVGHATFQDLNATNYPSRFYNISIP